MNGKEEFICITIETDILIYVADSNLLELKSDIMDIVEYKTNLIDHIKLICRNAFQFATLQKLMTNE